jgi:hypothetical protein
MAAGIFLFLKLKAEVKWHAILGQTRPGADIEDRLRRMIKRERSIYSRA